MKLKKRLVEQCIKPAVLYGCETWALTKTAAMKLIRGQRRLERAMLGIRISDRISSKSIRKRTGLSDWITCALIRKWNFAAKLTKEATHDWAKRTTIWTPKKRRPLGRPRKRWSDDLAEALECKKAEFDVTQHTFSPTRAAPYVRIQLESWVKGNDN